MGMGMGMEMEMAIVIGTREDFPRRYETDILSQTGTHQSLMDKAKTFDQWRADVIGKLRWS